MVARAPDPIWAAIRAHPSLAGHRIQQQHLRCQTCSRDELGNDKPGNDFTAMHPDHVGQHERSVDHLRRVAEGRVMPGPMIVNGVIIIQHVVQCLHCSLTTQGYRRAKYCRMDGPTNRSPTWAPRPTSTGSLMVVGCSMTSFIHLATP